MRMQQIFVTTLSTPDPYQSVVQDSTIEITIDYLFHIGAEKAILFGKIIVISLLKSSENFEECSILVKVKSKIPSLPRGKARILNHPRTICQSYGAPIEYFEG